MAFYLKPPVPIEAYPWTGQIIFDPNGDKSFYPHLWSIETFSCRVYKLRTYEGPMELRIGDYILKGIEGEYWAVRKSVFEKTYKLIENK